MVSCVRNHSREAAAAPSRPWMATSRRHPLFLFFGNPTGQAPSSTQATVGFSHVRRTHKHVIRHRLTGHETIHNAKLTVKRARRTRAHDERRHVPRNSHGPTQARRTNISRVRHETNTRAIVFTTTTTRQPFFTQTQLCTKPYGHAAAIWSPKSSVVLTPGVGEPGSAATVVSEK